MTEVNINLELQNPTIFDYQKLEPLNERQSLKLLTYDPKSELEKLLNLKNRKFEVPELFFFHQKYGPKSLSVISNEIDVIGDYDNQLKSNLVNVLMNSNWNLQLIKVVEYGLTTKKLNGEKYFGVVFNIKNAKCRGHQDSYLLFTKLKDKVDKNEVDDDQIEMELNEIAEMYISLIEEDHESSFIKKHFPMVEEEKYKTIISWWEK